ncbi:MAG: hypothetical protein M1358_05995 [Chloroflexi bacterium]|nr:hypothetical protein [Chloroflexota bacterium]
MQVELPFLYLLAVILSTWGVVGFARGALPEAVNLAGIFISWVFVATLGQSVLDLVNRLARTVLFLVKGGLDAENPSNVVRSLSGVRLVDTGQPQMGLAILFIVMVTAFFVFSRRFESRRTNIVAKVLGSISGALNGYLAAFVIFQAPSPKAEMVVTIGAPSVSGADSLGPYLSGLVIVAVGLIIVVGLMVSMRSSRSTGGTQFAGRRRG